MKKHFQKSNNVLDYKNLKGAELVDENVAIPCGLRAFTYF